MSKNILITGIAGLLGSRLADWIIENTDNVVIGIDDLSGGYRENINKDAIFYEANLVDLQKIDKILIKIKYYSNKWTYVKTYINRKILIFKI